MKKQEIMDKMSESIALLMLDGYHLELTELRCLFSDANGHAVLAKGNEREVVWFNQHRVEAEEGRRRRLCVLDLNRAHITLKGRETMDNTYRDPRKWAEHIVETYRFYNIDGWGDSVWYVESIEELDAISAKRRTRERGLHDDSMFHEFEITDELLRVVRKVKGFKTIKRDNLRVWRSNSSYCIQNVASGNKVWLS